MSKVGDFLSELKFVQSTLRWSKQVVLPGFKGFPLYDILNIFFKNLERAGLNINLRAGSISFFFLLAIPPTCIFLFTLLPYVPIKNLESTIYLFIRDLAPNKNTYDIMHGVIHDFMHTQRTGLLSFSFVLAIFYSASAVTGILRTFNRDHPGFIKRDMIKLRWMGIKLNSLLILLLVVSIALMVILGSLSTRLLTMLYFPRESLRLIVRLVRWLIILAMFFTSISIVYTYGLASQKKRKFVTVGSVLATALTILSTLGFSFYVTNFSNYNKIYGSLGSIIVLMIWVYINSYVLLIGFEINTSIEILQRKKEANKGDTGEEEQGMKGLS